MASLDACRAFKAREYPYESTQCITCTPEATLTKSAPNQCVFLLVIAAPRLPRSEAGVDGQVARLSSYLAVSSSEAFRSQICHKVHTAHVTPCAFVAHDQTVEEAFECA